MPDDFEESVLVLPNAPCRKIVSHIITVFPEPGTSVVGSVFVDVCRSVSVTGPFSGPVP